MQRKLSDCETKGRPISHKLYTCLLVSNFKRFVILFIKSHYTESSMSEEKNLKPYSTIRQIIFEVNILSSIDSRLHNIVQKLFIIHKLPCQNWLIFYSEKALFYICKIYFLNIRFTCILLV